MKERIKQGIAVVKKVEVKELDFGNDTDLIEEVGLTSIQIMNLIFYLESEFNIIFDDDDLDLENFQTINNIEKVVNKQHV
ncbi:MAG: hypothetical protein GQ574_00135 [Crocinitomix sp.]|nr:hypothetical protein [Crocinitomix sp.]